MTTIAISVKASLETVSGSNHMYPATFANAGHNLVGFDKQTGTAKAVQIDSVGSFANRVEAVLAASGLLPEITTQVGNRTLSIHELPHRAYDAILRDSLLNDTPWRQSEIGTAVLGSTTSDATALFRYAPLTLLLGGWDSHGGDAVRGAKIARSLACEIWGYGVQTAKHLTQRIDPLGITKDSAPHAIIEGILTEVTADWRGRDNKPGKKPSELGHGDVPGEIAKGVFVDRMEFSGAVSLSRLKRYHFPDEAGVVSEDWDAAAREVLVDLGVYGILAALDNLDLRSGCELVTTHRKLMAVAADGTRTPITLDTSAAHAKAIQSIAKASERGLTFAGPVHLTAGPALAELADRVSV